MEETISDPLAHILSNVEANVSWASFSKIKGDWRRLDYVPQFSRLYYILDGEGWIEVDGKPYYPKRGQLVLMPCGTKQSFSTISDHTYTKYWCHFTATIGNIDLFQQYQFPVCIDVPLSDRDQVAGLFEKMVFHFQKNKKNTHVLNQKAALLELLGYYIDLASISSIPNPVFSTTLKINKVLQYIEEHLSEKVPIVDLARLIHYHPNYFIRFFHSMLGCSPLQYMNKMKLEKAKTLLKFTHIPVSEIARAVGVAHQNFTPMFKSYTGFTPTRFRQMVITATS